MLVWRLLSLRSKCTLQAEDRPKAKLVVTLVAEGRQLRAVLRQGI